MNVTWKMENMETVVTLRGQLLSKSDNDHFSMKMVVMMMMVIVRIRLCQRQQNTKTDKEGYDGKLVWKP